MKRGKRNAAEQADDEFGEPRMPDRIGWLVIVALVTSAVILGAAIVTIRW